MFLRRWSIPTSAPSGSAADAGDVPDEDVDLAADDTNPPDETSEGLDTTDVDGSDVPDQDVPDEPPAKSLADYGLPEDPEVLAREFNSHRQRSQQLEALYWQMQQQAAAQRQPVDEKPTKPKTPWGEVPEYNPNWLSQIEQDATGRWVAMPGNPPDLPQKIEAYRNFVRDAQQKFFADPIGTLQEGFMPLVEQKAQEIAQRLYAQEEQKRALRDYEAKNKELYFNPDGSLNYWGQQFNQGYQMAVQLGYSDPIGMAEQSVDAALMKAHLQRQAAEAATPTEEEKKTSFLRKAAKQNGAGRIPNRGKQKAPSGAKSKDDVWAELRGKLESLPPEDFRKD